MTEQEYFDIKNLVSLLESRNLVTGDFKVFKEAVDRYDLETKIEAKRLIKLGVFERREHLKVIGEPFESRHSGT